MKRKLFSLAMILVLAVSCVGCGEKKQSETTTTSQLETDIKTYEGLVTLGNYKGIEVTVDRSTLTVTDDDVNNYINQICTYYAESTNKTEGVTKSGDSIILDYSGKKDGVAFSGGTATDATYTVGSGQFITDLDQGLIGLTVGQQYDIPCTFPANYSTADLAGQPVVFTVTVTAIVDKVIPEYNDEFVAKVAANFQSDAKTTDEFTKFVKEYLESQALDTFNSNEYQQILTKIKEDTQVSSYPEAEVNQLIENIKSNVQSEYESYGSYYNATSLDAYLSTVYNLSSQDAFQEYADNYAKNYLKEKMIITMIAAKENITANDDETTAFGEELAKYYGYDSYQAVLELYGDDTSTIENEVLYSVISDKVIDFLLENDVEKTE